MKAGLGGKKLVKMLCADLFCHVNLRLITSYGQIPSRKKEILYQ